MIEIHRSYTYEIVDDNRIIGTIKRATGFYKWVAKVCGESYGFQSLKEACDFIKSCRWDYPTYED